MDSPPPAICLLAESTLDREAYRALFRRILKTDAVLEADFSPVHVATAACSKPQVVILIADTCTSAARKAIETLRRISSHSRVVALTSPPDAEAAAEWNRCHLQAWILKTDGIQELQLAIERALANERHFSTAVREHSRNHPHAEDARIRALSRRERELFPLLASGQTLRDAAARMSISYKTADSYRTSLLKKLGVRDRVGLTRLAIRENVIQA